jgi:hypothetical protein
MVDREICKGSSVEHSLDYSVVRTPDGRRHARVRGVPLLLCGREVPAGAREYLGERAFDCPECREEATRRGDRSVGVVEA